MLRRFFTPTDTAPTTDPLVAVERMLETSSVEERGLLVLRQIAAELNGDVRGIVVSGRERGTYRIEAIHGYADDLRRLEPQHGPWRDPGPRILGNLIQELFTPNSKELRNQLGELGLREPDEAMVVPLPGASKRYGALMLTRHGGTPFREEDLKRVTRWGEILGGVLDQAAELRQTRLSLVEFTKAFVEAMEAQDFTQLGHAGRVTSYALALGRLLELDRETQADLYFAAMLHDIGKLGAGTDLSVEDSNHPLRGANLVASSPLLARAADGIRSHHEAWDGTGFPKGLRKDQIPLLGRIVAVADSFDLLSSERGQAMPLHEVEKELEARAGRELDPDLVQRFINILRQGRSTAELGRLDESDLPF